MRWRIGPGVLAATAASILMSAAVATAQSSPPSTSADPGLDVALGAIELMNRVPVGIRETCRPTDTFIEGMAITVECTVDGGIVFYSRFTDDAAVQAAYESLRASSGTDRDTGPGCAEGAFEAAYATRMACRTAASFATPRTAPISACRCCPEPR